MRSFSGQAARHTGRLLHHLAQFAFAAVVLAAVALAVLSWRLSNRPLDIPWLGQRLAAAVNADISGRLSLGSAALAWEGFREGVDRPLDLRVTQLLLTDAAGLPIAAVPRAEVSLSVGWLLLGRLVPRAIEIDGPRLRVVRDADGSVTFDLVGLGDVKGPPAGAGGLSALLGELARPAAGDRATGRLSRWSQLQRIRVRDAAVSVADRQLGVAWQVPALNVDLRRQREGGVAGRAEASLALGDQRATLTATAAFGGEARSTQVAAHLTPLVPAALARLMPAAAALGALDAPVTLSATAELDAALHPTHLAATADLGAGSVHVGQGSVPLLDARLAADGTLDRLHLELSRLATAPRPDGPPTLVQGQADLARGPDGAVQATGTLALDQVAFADLPALWPQGIGGNGARPWVTQNITDGVARNGRLEVSATLPADLSDVTLTHVAGGIDGHGLTVHWLRPVPPIDHGEARLNFPTPDSLDIVIAAGRQTGGSQGGLQVRNGRVVITGLNDKDQYADIEGDIAGPVPDLLTLLKHPKVRLLDRSPLKLQDAAGQIAGRLTLTRLPMRDDVTFDSLQIRTQAKLSGLRLPGIAAGRDLDHGAFSLDVSPDGLHAAGSAQVAGIPAQMQLDMDFRAGPPSQVLQTIALSGSIDERQLASFGVDASGMLAGPMAVDATLTVQRDGTGDATVHADLDRAAVTLARANFAKPAGQAASLSAHIRLAGDRVAAVDALRADGDTLHLDAAVDFADGAPAVVRVARLVLGSGTDAHGVLRLPGAQDRTWVVSLAGASLDASAELRRSPTPADQASKPAAAGPPWRLDAQMDRVIVGPGRVASAVAAHAESDGQVLRAATLSGSTQGGAGFRVVVEPQGNGRKLTASTADAGGLLRLFDIMDTMQGGRMTVAGRFDDASPDHPLAGSAEITDFRIRNAPILARLLQAMTLYGLVELAQGPGLGFTRLVAPFRLAGDTLTLFDARAFSASLGMTAKGDIDLARQTADVTGTIVPAYFFNALLGNIPFVGRLFSPERGGGVFAATYAVRGPLAQPDLSINPLAALTPGFLRGVFGLFDRSPDAAR